MSGDDPIYKELVSLREHGLKLGVSNKPGFPRLQAIADSLYPNETNATNRLSLAIEKAADRRGGRTGHAMKILWGCGEYFGRPYPHRREKTLYLLDLTEESYNRYYRKPIAEDLAAQLRALQGDQDDGQPHRRLFRHKHLFVALVAVAALAAGAVVNWSGSGSVNHPVILPVGAAVNANSGQVELKPKVTARQGSAYIDGGDIMRVCDLTRESPCSFSAPPNHLHVQAGDVLLFKTLLHNSGFQPIPYAKLFVSTGGDSDGRPWLSSSETGVSLELVWAGKEGPEDPERPNIAEITLQSPAGSLGPALQYIDGSTELLNPEGHSIATLPDGVMSSVGLALTEVGMPKGCFECDTRYTRFVTFRAHTTAGHSSDHQSGAALPRGAAINANTGVIEQHPTIAPPTSVKFWKGWLFRACNFTVNAHCLVSTRPVVAHIGDTLKFIIMLQNEAESGSLPYAKVSIGGVRPLSLPKSETVASMQLVWPTRSQQDSREQRVLGKLLVKLPEGSGPGALRLVPGSGVLFRPGHQVLARLPDSLNSPSGVALTKVGIPEACFFDCRSNYIRYLEFKARLVKSPYEFK